MGAANMIVESREEIITKIEDHFCQQITFLFDENRQDDAHSFYMEFVVDGEEPEEWTFISDLTDV